ncbi:MAG: hypothetical protein R3C52_05630 [Hyphomonadaceae bacterium]
MRKEYRYSTSLDWGVYGIGLVFILFAVVVAVTGQWLATAFIGVAGAGIIAAMRVWRQGAGPFLVLDDCGLRAPPIHVDIPWSNIIRVWLHNPRRPGRGGVRLAFEVRDERQVGPGLRRKGLFGGIVRPPGAPKISFALPKLNVKPEKMLKEIEGYLLGRPGREIEPVVDAVAEDLAPAQLEAPKTGESPADSPAGEVVRVESPSEPSAEQAEPGEKSASRQPRGPVEILPPLNEKPDE